MDINLHQYQSPTSIWLTIASNVIWKIISLDALFSFCYNIKCFALIKFIPMQQQKRRKITLISPLSLEELFSACEVFNWATSFLRPAKM